MDLNLLLYSVGATGFFSSRAFLPAFVTALLLRFGDALPLIGNAGLFAATGSEPTWFTHDYTLVILGALALLELLATKNPELQLWLENGSRYVKTALAALTVGGIVSAQDASFISGQLEGASLVWPAAIAVVTAGVFFTSGVRGYLYQMLTEIDPEDDLKIRFLLSWMEDLWATWGILLLLVYPLFMAGVVLVLLALMRAVTRRFERRSEQQRYPCPQCSHQVRALALSCAQCGVSLPHARRIGLLGQVTEQRVVERDSAAHALIRRKRCSSCAARIKERGLDSTCSECGQPLFKSSQAARDYLARLDRRLPLTLLICALLSFIPVLGLIPGVLYYRLVLLAGLRTHLSLQRTFFVRWFLRLLFFCLVLLQLMPGIGALALPTMALVSYATYRKFFCAQLSSLNR